MELKPMRLAWLAVLAFVTAGTALAKGVREDRLEFNRDVRPVLSANCFACHGPDAKHRKADLRLDMREVAVSSHAIEPGKPDESELVRRIESADEDETMPPPVAHKKLSDSEKATLRRWIAEGAVYQGHWSYLAPVKPSVPAGTSAIDYLVRRRLDERGWKPSPEADRRTLIRRVYFDLIGLPPPPEKVEAFVANCDPQAYGRVVEELLASPHYGERMAIGWLDAVRFADTIGYHSDNPRNVWPYRDYVIGAFNENKRFDAFTIEQLAGDLLPDSSTEQKVASCFNRLLLTTEEGGAQAKDYEARMLTDRVRAVGTVWLGQTLGCCQCHDHKFDPLSARDFYSMGAFFADIDEPILGARESGMAMPTAEQSAELASLEGEIAAAERALAASTPERDAAQARWESKTLAAMLFAAEPPVTKGASEKPAAKESVTAEPPKEIARLLWIGPSKRTDSQKRQLAEHYRSIAPELEEERTQLECLRQAKGAVEETVTRCLVSKSAEKPRVVRVLPRGNWMDESGPIVEPAYPAALAGGPTEKRRLTRLDLARWLVGGKNPLTARVFMNRLWKQFFGIGISRTVDDLGSQGEWPSNPELLDWLACEFLQSGWDVKHMVREIVVSQTYRQASTASAEQLIRDPENRLLARQSRFRLDAELVRDNALAISGLLVPTIGGPSVKPYQPAGYWENLNFPPREYVSDTGPSQYRRGLYTWWQRTFLHPSLLAFDAPSREECTAERTRSNLPQQALVLLNDPTYVEAAKALAVRMIQEGGADTASRVEWAWRVALGRKPRADEVATVCRVLEKHRGEYATDPAAAEAILRVGLAPVPGNIPPVELAAWMSVARIVLNLHEVITRS